MQYQPIDRTSVDNAQGVRRDWIVAMLLAIFLSACWMMTDWSQIGQLNLPDTDDMMRLAQVRDWVAGQAFNDWTQYRLAPPQGGAMHWSRINDVGPALIILLLDPVIGRYGAELAAVLVYPALLFITYLFLSARMARRLRWWWRRSPIPPTRCSCRDGSTTMACRSCWCRSRSSP
jgi:hypothetical protein